MRYVTSRLSLRTWALTAVMAVLTILSVSLTSSVQAVGTMPLTQFYFVPLDEDDAPEGINQFLS